MSDLSLEALERFKNVPEQMAWSRRHRIAVSIKATAEALRRKGLELPGDKTSFEAQVKEAQSALQAVDPRSITPEVTQIGEARRAQEARLAISSMPQQTYDMSAETVRNVNSEDDYVQEAA